ncbi:MAG: Superoxide dismutase [Candidatus Amesbacteria bacterium GW2011_GWA1_47_16]|uniref:Superoxide dismutase n=3 Tax=Candidatus Amesiibacteriota TaxID=1752730 RepID=A0A0G1V2U7_9BACT|nr:MAG: Superoxide dismutase [Candidatus Amesbacteria bacterium GW2011_GWC1_47_15]KKU64523.1 MAG: Superoxide dismutase [Candidatus Amesbacteria bacterium GW2011_GWA1_47_16]OGC98834.1 MAG: superoxide dismutase [Candidatus Amesbacteria bacterium RIFCSPHIGHO2_01_FULL_47_34]OGD01060.1 MAG: superoxide dismutase [Candidatus Amesbacteria bacterium RIFCSPLOWO2_01_FULL_47_33]
MFQLPSLPYSFDALEPYIDAATMEIHHARHHGTYVKNLNDSLPGKTDSDLQGILGNLKDLPDNVRTKVQNNGGGHANHSFFWPLMTPDRVSPSARLVEILKRSGFDELEDFKKQFTEAALTRFGSGWAWLVKDGEKLLVISTPNQDSPLMTGKTPVLGLDVWEHAYYLKYQNRRADYIAAWWQIVNWKQVEKNLILLSES